MINRPPIIADVLAAISGLGGVAAWQDQLDWAIRVVAGCVAIIAGLISIYYSIKRGRRVRVD